VNDIFKIDRLILAARSELLDHDIGVLSASTAFGKTVVAAYLIAKRGVNTLILVNTRSSKTVV
jgi:superfamily II DNA or RNA helicase